MGIEDHIKVLSKKLGAIASQIEVNGPDVAESWVAEQHDEQETRELLICSMIVYMEGKYETGFRTEDQPARGGG